MENKRLKVGITHGDFNGIGYETIIKALSDPRMEEMFTPVVYGSPKAAAFYKKTIPGAENLTFNVINSAADADRKRINLVACVPDDIAVTPGETTPQAGAAAVAALKRAVEDIKKGVIDVIVTAPISKENVQSAEFPFTGHTEFFASEFEGNPLMLMCSDVLKVGLTTIHIPVSEISRAVTMEKIVDSLNALRKSLIRDFSVHEPKIAVLALNPHTGDGGLIGDEEQTRIRPAIREAVGNGVLAFGPFAADGFFASAGYAKYDAVLAMYHDQGLAPFKALSGAGVNYTAGLTVVRTSPAHGVGFDIAGRNMADESSMRSAIYAAIDIYRSRKIYENISADPLRKFKRDTGRDMSVSDLPDQTED